MALKKFKGKNLKSHLSKYFKTITISEDVGFKKPSKEIFLQAVTRANAVIENSVDDWRLISMLI